MKRIAISAVEVSAFAIFIAIVSYAYWGKGRNADMVLGGDRDANGCIGSAGYSWCEEKAKCLRTFEETCTRVSPKEAVFECAQGKTITAVFYPGEDKAVDLKLSDGTLISVPRAISASGARYAKEDESFVFWNKGDTAFITENGLETYSNCAIRL